MMKRLLVVCTFAYLHTFTIAYSSPAVSVWRGETAYVDIPAGVNGELVMGNGEWVMGKG